MDTRRDEIGMIGLGVMGRNMLLNMADHGFLVAGYDKDPAKVEALQKESAGTAIHSVADIKDFIGLLRRPRAVMMLVPAGPPVDSVIGDLLPHLEKGDLTRSATCWITCRRNTRPACAGSCKMPTRCGNTSPPDGRSRSCTAN